MHPGGTFLSDAALCADEDRAHPHRSSALSRAAGAGNGVQSAADLLGAVAIHCALP